MKRKLFVLFLGVLLVSSNLAIPPVAHAISYTPLEPIPGFETASDFPSYVSAIYKFGLWAVGIAAIFMLTIGGGMYLTSAGNTSATGNAKGVITDAIIGLILALTAWFLLNFINPNILNGDLSIFSTMAISGGAGATGTAATGGGTTPTALTSAQQQTAESAAQTLLNSSNVSFNDPPSCSSSAGKVGPKTNLQEIVAGKSMTTCHKGCSTDGSLCTGASTINVTLLSAIATLANSIRLDISSVATGDHSASSNHYSGNAIDITKNGGTDTSALSNYITKNSSSNCKASNGQTVYNVNGIYFYDENAAHWHVQTSPMC